jgi:ribosomal protein S18 acetylase RimI-like enzyme
MKHEDVMEIKIRRINHESFDEVRYFFVANEYCWRDSDPSVFIPRTEAQRDKIAKEFMEHLSKEVPKYKCIGAYDGDQLIGCHFLDIYEIDNKKACHVHGLWVDKEYRKLGLGKKLKTEGEKWASSQNCEFMDANVSVSNTNMIKLNEDLGYEVARYNFRKRLKAQNI